MVYSTRWRINISANSGGTFLDVGELQMRAIEGGADQCAGGTASASSYYPNYDADYAFDDVLNTRWVAASGQTTGWLEYEFPSPVEVLEYAIELPFLLTRAPKDWTFEYWDGDEWIVADTQAGITGWANETFKVFTIGTRGTGLFDGKLIIESAEAFTKLLDGKAIIADEAAVLLDGLARVAVVGDNQLDGLVRVRDFATVLFDGLVSIPLMVRTEAWAWAHIAPAAQWALPAALPQRDIYICTLRADGFADVELPMSSFQMRRRNNLPTMVSVVVPDAMTYLDAAEDRVGGEIIISAGKLTLDGVRHLSEFERASFDSLSYDHGTGSSSLSIEGYRTAETINPRPVDLSGLTYYGLQADGKRRVRGAVNIFLRPGDTAVFSGDSFVVDLIYVKVEAANSWMEAAGV